jgi:dihydrofolate reductase
MRKLVVTQNISVDGRIEMLDDWFDPSRQDEDLLAESRRQDAECDALLLGRTTFEDFRGYWPDLTDDPTGISEYLNKVTKYVVSSTLAEPGWVNSTVVGGDPISTLRALKSAPARDIVVTGSISLTHTLIGSGLVDEYRLFVYPAVQGGGRRLFGDGAAQSLRLLDTPRSFAAGIALLVYGPA